MFSPFSGDFLKFVWVSAHPLYLRTNSWQLLREIVTFLPRMRACACFTSLQQHSFSDKMWRFIYSSLCLSVGGATLARSTSHVNIALRCFLPGKAQWQENMSVVDKKSIQNNALPFWNTALSQLKQKRLRWWRGTFSRVFHFRISMVNSGEQETTVYGKGSCIFSCESRNDASFLL